MFICFIVYQLGNYYTEVGVILILCMVLSSSCFCFRDTTLEKGIRKAKEDIHAIVFKQILCLIKKIFLYFQNLLRKKTNSLIANFNSLIELGISMSLDMTTTMD